MERAGGGRGSRPPSQRSRPCCAQAVRAFWCEVGAAPASARNRSTREARARRTGAAGKLLRRVLSGAGGGCRGARVGGVEPLGSDGAVRPQPGVSFRLIRRAPGGGGRERRARVRDVDRLRWGPGRTLAACRGGGRGRAAACPRDSSAGHGDPVPGGRVSGPRDPLRARRTAADIRRTRSARRGFEASAVVELDRAENPGAQRKSVASAQRGTCGRASRMTSVLPLRAAFALPGSPSKPRK